MEELIKDIMKLRKKLNSIPEESLYEIQTKKELIGFIKKLSNIEIVDKNNWFYCKYTYNKEDSYIAFRADYDAVKQNGVIKHLCGHDGHSAILAGFVKYVSEIKPKKNIIFLFQPAEEIGSGANICKDIFNYEKIDEIYAFHNIPGYKENSVIIKNDTICLSSIGLEIKLIGKTSHAAYPEYGISVEKGIISIMREIDDYFNKPKNGFALKSLIGIDSGSDNFGSLAGSATINYTIRAENMDDFNSIIDNIYNTVSDISNKNNLKYDIIKHDYFLPTINHQMAVKRIKSISKKLNLEVIDLTAPFRWSEDFGQYLNIKNGAFFGVGIGIDACNLHTENYKFNDNIIETVLNIYIKLIS